MACNNTTYIAQVFNSSELANEYFKVAFIVNTYNYNIPAAMMINKLVTPVWIVVGVFGNTLSALVWANPHMRTCNTAAYYLTCLAIADLAFLINQLIYELENPWLLGSLDATGWCQIFNVWNMSVQYFCVFLVFAFTVERFLSICHPFKSERFGKTRTPRIIFGLFLMAISLGLPQAFFWKINFVGECGVREDQNADKTSFFAIYTWISELAIFGVLPLTVLVLNSAVLLKIRSIGQLNLNSVKLKSSASVRSSRSVDEANNLVPPSEKKKPLDRMRSLAHSRYGNSGNGGVPSSNHSGTTITLLWVSFYLIATMLPNTLLYALHNIFMFGPLPCQTEDMGNHPTWQTYFSFMSVRLIIKEISLSHHVGNIFIYMATSRRFVKLALKNITHRSKSKKEMNDTTLHTIRTHSPYTDRGHV